MKKIKIAQFVGSMNCGGTETMLMNLYKKFDKEKYEFIFIEDVEEKCWYDDNIKKLGGRIIKIQPFKIRYAFEYIKQLVQIFKKEKFDVVHSHVFLHSGLVMLAAKKAKIPIRISHSHSAMKGIKEGLKCKLKKFILQKLILKYSTNIVACSTEAGLYLFGKSFQKIGIVLPNPIQLELINEVDKNNANQEMREKHHITNDTFVIGHVGRLVDIKNHRFLIELAKRLIEENFDFKMFFIGDGPERRNLEDIIKKECLENNIIMTGIEESYNIYKYMKMFDIFLLPSFYEGLPVTLIESQASNLYSVVSENVSKESDLGLGLIQFESIENVEQWKKIIMNFEKKSISQKEINDVINERGYSSDKSIIEYQKLYTQKNKKKEKINHKSKKEKFIVYIVPLIIATILGILSYMFYPKDGYDLCSYYSWMGKMLTFNNLDLVNYIFHNGEFIIMTYFYLIARIGNFHLVQFFPTLIIYYIVLYIIFDYARARNISWKNILIVILIFLSLFKFVFAVSSFRYTLAYSIFSLGIYLDLVKNNNHKFIKILYVIPLFIHISSLILLMFRLIFMIKNKLVQGLIVFSIVAISIFPNAFIDILNNIDNIQVLNYISSKINIYLVEEQVDFYFQYFFRIGQTILMFLVNLLIYFKYKTDTEKKYHTYFYLIGIFTVCIIMRYSIFMRLCDFILILSPILIFKFLDVVKKFKFRWKVISMFGILLLILAGIRIQIPIFEDMYFGRNEKNESNYCIYSGLQ